MDQENEGGGISVIDSATPTSIKPSPMTKLTDLTTTQLHQIIAIKEQIETLQSQIDSIAGR